MPFVRLVLRLLLGGLLGCAAAGAAAQPYPAKSVRIVVPYAPGGASDALARSLAQRLSSTLGQQVLVDNRPGGNTIIGTEHVVKAAPDGHTLLLTAEATLVANPALYARLPYDPQKDFEAITALVSVPQALAVTATSPARTLKDFIEQAKRDAGRLSYASLGTGSTAHLNMELFQRAAGVRLIEASYKGAAPALTDLVGGHVASMIVSTGLLAPHAQGGRLRVLAVNGERRSALLPDVPTFAEAGLPGFAPSSWFALLAPAGTPKAVVARLNGEINQAWSDREFVERAVLRLGLEPIGGSPEELSQRIRSEGEKWGRMIREAGIRLE